MHILVTRPEPAATQTAARLATLGHQVTVDPMLRIVPLEPALPAGPFDAVAFTSVNGVKAFTRHPAAPGFLDLPAFAVGPRTAREARAVGFRTVTDCDGDASALAAHIAAALPAGARVINPAGEDRAADLKALLAAPEISLELVVIYAAAPAEALAAPTRAALASGTVTAALHFSQRTVKTLLRCVAAAGLTGELRQVRELCLSEQVAEPLATAGFAVEVAAAANEDALLALL